MVTSKFTGPSGAIFEIREQNGEDDNIISKMSLGQNKELIVLNQFLAGIIISINDMKPVTPEIVEELLLRDKYAILIKARIFSLGPDMVFTYQWDKDLPPAEYSENLEDFVWDYSKDFPYNGSPDYKPLRIEPYKNLDEIVVKTENHSIILDLLTGKGETYLFNEKVNMINNELIARNIRIQTGDGVKPIKNFGQISSRDLSKVRKAVRELDPIPTIDIQVENIMTGQMVEVPLLSIRDFFFPTHL